MAGSTRSHVLLDKPATTAALGINRAGCRVFEGSNFERNEKPKQPRPISFASSGTDSTPKGWTRRRQLVANAASQEIGSSTQALINGRHCSHGTEGTQASRVGRTRAGGLPTVTGPRQLMRQPIHGS